MREASARSGASENRVRPDADQGEGQSVVCYGAPRNDCLMRFSREPVFSAPVDLASAVSQSTQPASRIRQVLLSIMRLRQNCPLGDTTRTEPLRSSAALSRLDCGLRFVCDWPHPAKNAPMAQTPSTTPAATTARWSSPVTLRADGLGAFIEPVARMWDPFVAAQIEGRLRPYRSPLIPA